MVWFEENSNALGAMVKGGSNSLVLDRSSMVTTLYLLTSVAEFGGGTSNRDPIGATVAVGF